MPPETPPSSPSPLKALLARLARRSGPKPKVKGAFGAQPFRKGKRKGGSS